MFSFSSSLLRWAALAAACAACAATAGCTTTGSSAGSRADSGESRGSMTIFGDIDAGVSRVR